jgi:hypothetical protein
VISVHDTGQAGALGELSRFRQEFYGWTFAAPEQAAVVS